MDILLGHQCARCLNRVKIRQQLGHLAYTAAQVTDNKDRIKWQEESARQYTIAQQLYMDVTHQHG